MIGPKYYIKIKNKESHLWPFFSIQKPSVRNQTAILCDHLGLVWHSSYQLCILGLNLIGNVYSFENLTLFMLTTILEIMPLYSQFSWSLPEELTGNIKLNLEKSHRSNSLKYKRQVFSISEDSIR